MTLPDFTTFPLTANLALFAGASACVWIAGTRLARYADAISVRTGLTQGFIGILLLGVVTSLPEIATTASGAWIGNARLVSGNLLGGVALQVAMLAIVDAAVVRGALTYFAPRPVLLFQGTMLILLLAITLAGAAAGEPVSLFGVGLTPILLAAGYLLTLRGSQGDLLVPRWQASDETSALESSAAPEEHSGGGSSVSLSVRTGLGAAVILAAGWTVAMTGDALAEQTGLGDTFVGLVLVAASTSLPELSTTSAAVRHGNYQMAIANILGTNCLELALFLPADILYRGGPLLASLEPSALFAAALGLIVTCIFLLGLLERRNRTVFGMGLDSLAVLVVYGVGMWGVYALR